MDLQSVDIGRAALEIAMAKSREDETQKKQELKEKGIFAAAVDFGGEFLKIIPKIMEYAVVAAQREGVVSRSHVGAGVVAGATHNAIEQISAAATGFNVGGKIGIARYGEHLCVAVFAAVGLLNLDEICVGLSHRTLDSKK